MPAEDTPLPRGVRPAGRTVTGATGGPQQVLRIDHQLAGRLLRDSGMGVTLLQPATDPSTGHGWLVIPVVGAPGGPEPLPKDRADGSVETVRRRPDRMDIPELEPLWERVWSTGVAEPVAVRVGSDGSVASNDPDDPDGGPAGRLTGWCFRTADSVGMFWRRDDPLAGADVGPDTSGTDAVRADAEDAAAIGSWELDLAGREIELSPAAAVVLRLPPTWQRLSAEEILAVFGADERTRVAAVVRAAAATDAPFTTRFTVGDGARRTVRAVGRPVTVRGRDRIAGIVEDVTETDRAERTAQRSQRLASLGMLAAGIAHDVNNVLTVVTMRADMIREDAEVELAAGGDPGVLPGFAADAGAILDAARRATELTRQLLLFAGRQEGSSAPVELAALAGRMRPLLESMRGSLVRTVWDLHPVPEVSADPSQLEQVLLNLAINARDALNESGASDGGVPTVTIRTSTGPDGDTALLEVVDNGPGMDPETAARACDPFFTTKAPGTGTGLGLSVVSGIVERLGGRLQFISAPGAGTTARVRLSARPRVGGERRAGPAAGPAPDRLLVVDDDPAVLATHARILGRAGYQVGTATDGAEALRALEADAGVLAVVSDVSMPGMDGTELTNRIMRDHPGVRVLLVTGLNPPLEVLVHARVGLVAKPVSSAGLLSALRSLLAS